MIALFIIGCKTTQVQTITINASNEDVWANLSELGNLSNYAAHDSSSVSPQGEATMGAIHYVAKGEELLYI